MGAIAAVANAVGVRDGSSVPLVNFWPRAAVRRILGRDGALFCFYHGGPPPEISHWQRLGRGLHCRRLGLRLIT